MASIGLARKLGERNPRPLRFDGHFAYVPLTRGKEAKIDASDAALVGSMTWSLTSQGYARAAYTNEHGKTVTYSMHRLIAGAGRDEHVDHADGDKLNNTKRNLRICEHYQNMGNRGAQKNNSSGAKGVSFCRQTRRWRAIITVKGITHRLGRFTEKADAAAAYDTAALALLGEFAKPNNGEMNAR
ncbi:AP2 domain-containing protein [Rhizobium sp. BK251]|uniref:AP2 domain-containing protein n=1 Tax=Rhizobium sp. BK251 TaxID=2512125 RepID=UPI0010F2A619|nr:AP2 domain-containing protein [Rhizobium sp. BK251]TCL70640.1 HNH endonuclease [Rhizobium sp. BK251]